VTASSPGVAPDSPSGSPVADVLVVGLGAAGLSCCLELAAAGVDVVGVDSTDVGSGASGRNGGFLLGGLALFHHDAIAALGRDRADAWYRATLEELDRTFAEELTAARVGSLRVAAPGIDEDEDIRRHHAALGESGFPVEAYEGQHGRGIRIPTDGQYEPLDRCHHLAERALAAGAVLARVDIDVVEPGQVVDVDGRPLGSPVLVIAIDGGLERLLPDVGVRTARLQMLATAPVAAGTVTCPVYRRFGLDYLRQASDGSLHVGGGRDLEGDDAWTVEPATTSPVQEHLEDIVASLDGDVAIERRWSAPSAWTADRLPICTTVMPGVHVIGGYSGHGNIIGPMLARHVAASILAGDDTVRLPF